MKIERSEGEKNEIAEAVRNGLHALAHGGPPPASEEARLLARRDQKWRRLRGHFNAFVSVMTGLGALNLVTWLVLGVPVPWVVFPAIAWGIGLGIHGLGHRGWVSDHAQEILAAEVTLGRLPAGAAPAALAAGPVETGPWPALLEQCRAAVDKTVDALTSADHPAHDLDTTHADLEEGLERIERLAAGAGRIDQALRTIAPRGLEGLDLELAAVDRDINAATDDRLREVHHENRALLVSRRAKVEALIADQARMVAIAKSFLLTTENLHLDSARLGQAGLHDERELVAPIRRLGEEVEILRKVEAELNGAPRT